jgi:hypothetical protein
MIDVLVTFLIWIAIAIGIVGACFVTYCVLYWLAKQTATQELQGEQQKLSQQRQDLEQREQKLKSDAEDALERVLLRKSEAISKEEKTAAILITVQKMLEEARSSVRRLELQNKRLNQDLMAARQRGRRLANKIKAEV